jgi:hypothetical protein
MKIRRSLSKQPVEAVMTIVGAILKACEGNPSATSLTTELTALTATLATLTTHRTTQLALQLEEQSATNATNTALAAVSAAFEKLAARTESLPGVTPEIAHGMAFEIYEPGRAPALGLLPAPENLGATMGDLDGTIDLALNRVHGAGSYVFQMSQTPAAAASWQQVAISARSSCTITGLTSGQKYWFRCAAIGTAGQGPWSNPASQQAT